MSDKPTPKKTKTQPKWLEIILLIIRIIRIPVLAVLAIFIGLWVGYTKLGHQPASEIFHLSTWKHLYDLVFAS
ncbi:DNA-directed RNA polymerase subunit beta [Paenibacillus sp. SYP-B3998]|uniref:DNA-directed RNA polymerase subunit beta n=1 Tax=Paenibacillus sp. SYP-B3998 TaxID=2678564 RepID=A0A6G4A3L1_9BACL|nr:DNA-directed RNA polymerase subunit beta [Paenibacillus sp. SYP-B3998]NEW08878.1 DNA-directed RNA polymerase subunit beta [Paenibacillus sp. SYP-B3998]